MGTAPSARTYHSVGSPARRQHGSHSAILQTPLPTRGGGDRGVGNGRPRTAPAARMLRRGGPRRSPSVSACRQGRSSRRRRRDAPLPSPARPRPPHAPPSAAGPGGRRPHAARPATVRDVTRRDVRRAAAGAGAGTTTRAAHAPAEGRRHPPQTAELTGSRRARTGSGSYVQ